MEPPTVDLRHFTDGSAEQRRGVAEDVHQACRTAGFLQVVGHGVDPALQSELEEVARGFFALETEEKQHVAMERGGRAWRGWFPLGGELTSGVPDAKEGYYFGTDLPVAHPSVLARRPLHGPNLYPEHPAELHALVDRWMHEVTAVGQVLLRAIALGLGLEEHWFDRWCAEPTVLFRIFRYLPDLPDASGEHTGGRGWGVGEHTDYGLLTLLAQDRTGGLEVRTGGRWAEIPPTPGALVCNLGDMLERVTGGLLVSTPHRVRVPDRERISMPLFLDPAWDAVIEPLPGTRTRAEVTEGRWDGASVFDGPAVYGDYLLAKVSRVFPELFDGAL